MGTTTQLLEPDIREAIAQRRFVELRDALRGFDPPDIAELLEEMEAKDAAVVFRLLYREAAAEAFTHLEPERQEELVDELGDERTLRLLEELSVDDRAAFLGELPAEAAAKLIGRLSPANRRLTQQILNYPDESVGRLMTSDYVRVRKDWTVGQAIEHIRRHGRDAETINWVFVVGPRLKLLDELPIRRLLLAEPDATIESLCDGRFVYLHATDDREEAVRVMARYDRTALPVVDTDGSLMGIVTFDDVADVAEEEATEDFQKLGGMEALDAPYMQTGLVEMLRKRGFWLCGLFVMQVLTIGVIDRFQGSLEKAAVLIVFIPLIISSGGNTGTQAASLVIRALALEEVDLADWRRVVVRELAVGTALGLVLGVMAWVLVLTLNALGVAETAHASLVGLAVGLAVLGIVVWGVLLGSLFPLILQRLRLDPAAISSPLVATLMDVSGLVIYLLVATVVLTGTLL
jgi:magnesium transporter